MNTSIITLHRNSIIRTGSVVSTVRLRRSLLTIQMRPLDVETHPSNGRKWN